MLRKGKIIITAAIVIISIVISYGLISKITLLEDYFLYRFKFQATQLKNTQIILVYFDDATVKRSAGYRLKRSEYAKVINEILKGKPKVIGIDIFFDDIKDLEDDMKLIEVLDKSDTDIVLAVYPLEVDNLIINKVNALFPHRFNFKNISIGDIEILDAKGTKIKKIRMIPHIDRRYEKEKEYLPFPIMVVSRYINAEYKQKPLPNGNLVAAIGGDIEIDITESSGMLINYIGGIEAFDNIAFKRVSEINPPIFKDKIVLIGASAESLGDIFITPISKKTPGVIIHANAIHTIINKRFITELPIYYQIIFAFVVCLITSILIYTVKPILSSTLTIILLFNIKFTADFIFYKFNISFLLVPLISSILLTFIGAIIEEMGQRFYLNENAQKEGK